MYDLTLSQELYGVTDIGIICKTQDIIVCGSRFLFWGDPVSTTYTKI